MKFIRIVNARENNLKNLSVSIPRFKLTSVIGPSGSGKSTLAFNVLANESNRLFLDALSLKNKNMFEKLDKADLDEITGISPAVEIRPRKSVSNIRSTVATATEIYNDLRLFFAYFGSPWCPECGGPVEGYPLDQMIAEIKSLNLTGKVYLLAPVVQNKKGSYKALLKKIISSGYMRFEIDGDIYVDPDLPELNEDKKHTIFVVIDRFKGMPSQGSRLSDAIENALKVSQGRIVIKNHDQKYLFSTDYTCSKCHIAYEKPTPALFSFNNPRGACDTCGGIGKSLSFDPECFVDKNLTLNEGAVKSFSSIKGSAIHSWMRALADFGGWDFDTPLKDFTKKQMELLLYGSDREVEVAYKSRKFNAVRKIKLEGIVETVKRRYRQTNSDEMRQYIEKTFMKMETCRECGGRKLKPFALSVLYQDCSISDLTNMSSSDLYKFFENIPDGNDVHRKLKEEILRKLGPLVRIGLGYLTLDRTMVSLSGGEENRIHLAAQLSSRLSGITYILDEPGTGLHPSDMTQLADVLKSLCAGENTVVIVDHDPTLIRSSDYTVELGPGAGRYGGELVFEGTREAFELSKTLSSKLVYYQEKLPSAESETLVGGGAKKTLASRFFCIYGASQYNLKNIDIKIPGGCFTVLCGVSGSGKSTLVDKIIYPYLSALKMGAKREVGAFRKAENENLFHSVYYVTQTQIGTHARSNPATYIGVFSEIRNVFASLGESKVRGFKASRFSFNAKGGRCEKCKGLGLIKVDMHYLPDIYITCGECGGRRYNRETLEVEFQENNIYDILEMTFDEAYEVFKKFPVLKKKIDLMRDTGLGYLKLGQPAHTLSGGESQRIKIASELGKFEKGRTLYILDEPTNGLHLSDIEKIIGILKKLTSRGHTVLVIEHNEKMIAHADYIIELGPGGGQSGGDVVFQGSVYDFKKVRTKTSECFYQ